MTLPSITSGPINFSEQPPIGHIHVYRDQFYFLIGVDERQGRQVTVWKTHCCNCGAAFEVTGLLKSSSGFSRRCAAHKRKGIKVVQRSVHKAALGYHDAAAFEPMAASAAAKADIKSTGKKEPGQWTAENPFLVYAVGCKADGVTTSQSRFDRIISYCVEKNIPYKIVSENKGKEELW